MGYKERFVDDCCVELANGKVVRLAQAPSANASNKRGPQQLDRNADPAVTGTTVWDGAVVLSQCLTTQPGLLQKQDGSRPVSLELGAGTGAVSLCLLAAGAVQRAIITDIPGMVAHLQQNVYHNDAVLDPQHAVVRPLRWGEAAGIAALRPYQPPFDVIVGSDLIYYSYTRDTPHSRLLLMVLQQLAGPETQIYLALSLHHNPEEVEKFLRWAQETWGFSVRHIREGIPVEYRVPDVLIVCMQLVDATAAASAAAAAKAGTLDRVY
eukprot:GHUV01037914.1.p1 GENE.GHUV01037914.1~~GHUV01037914.1.p1  ORF type:complete len:266 (-),score=61.15 GHUV01037914.1:23-820(-)